MLKHEELTNPESCLNRAREDEMLFVLLGRDIAAPVAIRAWVSERVRLGKNRDTDPQIIEALEWAKASEQHSGSSPAVVVCEVYNLGCRAVWPKPELKSAFEVLAHQNAMLARVQGLRSHAESLSFDVRADHYVKHLDTLIFGLREVVFDAMVLRESLTGSREKRNG